MGRSVPKPSLLRAAMLQDPRESGSDFLCRSARSVAGSGRWCWRKKGGVAKLAAAVFSFSHSKNHYLCGLDERGSSLAGFEVHFAGRSRRDDRGDLLFADGNYHFGHEAADLNALNSPDQLVSATEAAHHQ